MTSTARTQGIGQREERSGPTWPNQSRLGSNLAVLGLGPNLGVTFAELGPVCSNLGPTGVQHGATWAPLDASWAKHVQLDPAWGHLAQKWAEDKPNVGHGLARTPIKAKKPWTQRQNASFQRASLSPQKWLRLGGSPPGPNVGASCAVLSPIVGANWSC